jgi:imidazolonepropionase-like amidohydrolase
VAILIDGDRIVAVGPAAEVEARPEAATATVVDASACTILPGLIDGHVHVAWGRTGFPAWEAAAAKPELLMAWSITAAQAALRAGVTTMRDCGAAAGITLDLRQAIANGTVRGPHLQVCGPAITTTAGHGEFLGVTADSADELRRRVREWCRSGVDFIKIMATGGLSDPETNRLRAQYSEDELRAAVDDAHRLQRQVVAHVNATEGIRNAVAAGVDVLAHCNWLGAEDGTIDYDPAVAAEMARRRVFVDLNIEGAFRPFPTGDGWAQDWSAPGAPQNRWQLLDTMRQDGVPMFFTSDNAGPALADFPRLLVEAGQKGEISAEELVWRATGLAAEGIGLAAQTGTIAPDRVADLTIVDGDLVEDLSALLRVRAVYLAGELVVSDNWLAPAPVDMGKSGGALPIGLPSTRPASTAVAAGKGAGQ